ncbi:MAG: tail fiber domain-containing protein [Hyphomicrobium sp.]|nr:tail fiber domain-containing protein [Hyphomicrobium sp.]
MNYVGLESTGTGNITNAYAIRGYIADSGSGTITNGYGLYLDDVQATTGWGVYQLGSNDKNYFAGKVGLGVASPSQTLEMTGNLSMNDGGIIYGSDSSAANALYLQAAYNNYDGANILTFGRTHANDGRIYLRGATWSVGTEVAMYFQNWQNSTTANTLGYWRANGDLGVYGSVSNCVIGSGTGATNCTSDIRLKKDIKPIESALDKVALLEGVTFHWKDPKNRRPSAWA